MSMERDVTAHLYDVLKERLQNSDQQGVIDVYYELLSSGHSVGDILSAVGPLRIVSGHDNSPSLRHQQPTPYDLATNRASEIEVMGRAQANARNTDDLSLLDDAEIRKLKKYEPVKVAANNKLGPNNQEQIFSESLTRPGMDAVRSKATHISTAYEIPTDSGDQEPLRPSKRPVIGKQIAFVALFTAIIASTSIAGFIVGFSILNGGRNADSVTARTQSDIARGTETVAIPGATEVQSESEASTLIAMKQIVSAISSHASQQSQTSEPASIALGPLQHTRAEGRAKFLRPDRIREIHKIKVASGIRQRAI